MTLKTDLNRLRTIALTAVAAFAATQFLTGCFTGVESTPRITYKEVKNKHAGASSPEEALATSFVPGPFSEWNNGKKLYVTSERIGLVLSQENGRHDITPSEGDTLIYNGSRTAPDLLGNNVVELLFSTTGAQAADTLVYRTNATSDELAARNDVAVPFTIDLSLIDKVRSSIAGKDLYIKSAMWFTTEGNSVDGRKFVPVHIDNVLPANEIYPCKVVFTDNNGVTRCIYMSASAGVRWMPREFGSLFSFTDPRLSYPDITDRVWTDITNGRLSKGMTKTEATLALGNPKSIDRGHDHSAAYERWLYPDGIYLIFEDGLLVKFNH